jgi:hypothetical protein
MRVVTKYALTWLPLHDGKPASNRWRDYRGPNLAPLPIPKSRNLPAKGKAALPAKGKADAPYLAAKGKADRAKNLPAKGKVLYRTSYQVSASSLGVEGDGAAAGERVQPGSVSDQGRAAP